MFRIKDQGTPKELIDRLTVLEQSPDDPSQFQAAKELILAELKQLPEDPQPIVINSYGDRQIVDGKIVSFQMSVQVFYRHL